MLLVPIPVQQRDHRPRALHRRFRPLRHLVVLPEITLREAGTVSEDFELPGLLLLAVSEDPRGREHVERGFRHEVRQGYGAVAPFWQAED